MHFFFIESTYNEKFLCDVCKTEKKHSYYISWTYETTVQVACDLFADFIATDRIA